MKKPAKSSPKASAKERKGKVRNHRTALRARAKGLSWHKRFIQLLRSTLNVRASCDGVAIPRQTVYDHRNRYPDFRSAWDTAVEDAIDLLEEAAFKRATKGVTETVWMRDTNGKPKKVGEIKRYSDRMTEVLLKAHRPEKYRDRVSQEISGPGGAPIPVHTTTETFQIPEDEADQIIKDYLASRKNGHVVNADQPVTTG